MGFLDFLKGAAPVIGGIAGSFIPGLGTVLGSGLGGLLGGLLPGDTPQQPQGQQGQPGTGNFGADLNQYNQIRNAIFGQTQPGYNYLLQQLMGGGGGWRGGMTGNMGSPRMFAGGAPGFNFGGGNFLGGVAGVANGIQPVIGSSGGSGVPATQANMARLMNSVIGKKARNGREAGGGAADGLMDGVDRLGRFDRIPDVAAPPQPGGVSQVANRLITSQAPAPITAGGTPGFSFGGGNPLGGGLGATAGGTPGFNFGGGQSLGGGVGEVMNGIQPIIGSGPPNGGMPGMPTFGNQPGGYSPADGVPLLERSAQQLGPSAFQNVANAFDPANYQGLEQQAANTVLRNSRLMDAAAGANGLAGSGLVGAEKGDMVQGVLTNLAGQINQDQFNRANATNQFNLGRAGALDQYGLGSANFGLNQTQANNAALANMFGMGMQGQGMDLQRLGLLQNVLGGMGGQNFNLYNSLLGANQNAALANAQAQAGNNQALGNLIGSGLNFLGTNTGGNFLNWIGGLFGGGGGAGNTPLPTNGTTQRPSAPYPQAT